VPGLRLIIPFVDVLHRGPRTPLKEPAATWPSRPGSRPCDLAPLLSGRNPDTMEAIARRIVSD